MKSALSSHPLMGCVCLLFVAMYDMRSLHLSQNHDNQANITHLEEIQRELLVAPNSYTRLAPSGVGGEQGPGNYWVPVSPRSRFAHKMLLNSVSGSSLKKQASLTVRKNRSGAKTHNILDLAPSLILWFFDSRGTFPGSILFFEVTPFSRWFRGRVGDHAGS